MTHGRPTLSVERARDLDWRSARLEFLREAIVVLEAAARDPDFAHQRMSIKNDLARLNDGLAERERSLPPF